MGEADLAAVSSVIERATHPEDVFGILAGDRSSQQQGLRYQYRKLMEVIHPDHYEGNKKLQAVAHAAFVKASELLARAEQKIQAGSYGYRSKTEFERVDPDPPPSVVTIDNVKYTLERRVAQGDLCDLYACHYTPPAPSKPEKDPVPPSKVATAWSALMSDDDVFEAPPPQTESVLFKIVRSKTDNDLVENEARVLRRIYPAGQKDEKFFRYLPKLLDSVVYRTSRVGRRVNLVTRYDGMFSMAEVLGTYPNGLDYRDVVWMFKRLLVVLGFIHSRGFIHGAVIPPHVLAHPIHHGARLIDWSYAVERGSKAHVRAISKNHRTYYAPEILKKTPPTPAADIYMAAKCVVAMLGGNVTTDHLPDAVPAPIQRFFAGCLIANPSARPDEAWNLHDELDALLKKVVGKPRYRPLAMPPTAKA